MAEEKKVRAVVVRGSYTTRDADGNVKVVEPDKGRESFVNVPERHLETFAGILIRPEDLKMAQAEVAKERHGPRGARSMTLDEATSDGGNEVSARDRRRGESDKSGGGAESGSGGKESGSGTAKT